MEDAHFAQFPLRSFSNLGLFCVFDGFSGLACAKELTKIFPDHFSLALEEHKNENDDLEAVFTKTFAQCEEILCKDPALECVGSTCTAVAIWKSEKTGNIFIQSANLGDSNCVVCFDNEAIMLNEEHKVSNKKEIQRLRDSGFKVQDHITRLNGVSVARAFGVGFLKENNVGIIPIPFISKPLQVPEIKEKAFMIVASDGLWDVTQTDYIPSCFKKAEDPTLVAKTTSQSLISRATKCEACVDNVTTIAAMINVKGK